MKKFASLILFLMFLNTAATAEVVAPALQYLRADYPAAFVQKSDFSVKLKPHSRYKLRCSSDITSVNFGDKENLRFYTTEDEDSERPLWELMSPRDVTIKTRYETYSYIEIFKAEGMPATIMVSVNKRNTVPENISIGECTITERLD